MYAFRTAFAFCLALHSANQAFHTPPGHLQPHVRPPTSSLVSEEIGSVLVCGVGFVTSVSQSLASNNNVWVGMCFYPYSSAFAGSTATGGKSCGKSSRSNQTSSIRRLTCGLFSKIAQHAAIGPACNASRSSSETPFTMLT